MLSSSCYLLDTVVNSDYSNSAFLDYNAIVLLQKANTSMKVSVYACFILSLTCFSSFCLIVRTSVMKLDK